MVLGEYQHRTGGDIMYPVSQGFHDEMKADERHIIAKIQIDYTDPFLDQSIRVAASENANPLSVMQIADGILEPWAKFAALDGAWVLGQDWALTPGADDAKQIGWWGSQLADSNGSFAQPPTLMVTFLSRPITQLKVVGDNKRKEWPADFAINLYNGMDILLHAETVTGNTEIAWSKTLAEPVTQVEKMELVIHKWSHAGRQVKILEFFTSIQEVYEGGDILTINLLEEREVSRGSLPVGNISANEINIRLRNDDGRFDAGNIASPLYQLLKKNRRIKVWLGARTWQFVE
jgi:hypothetical protein